MGVTSIFFGTFPKPGTKQNRRIKHRAVTTSYEPLPKPTPEKLEFARKLRREMTPAENALLTLLKRNNIPFESQKVVYGYITDFWCQKYNTCIEADGRVHLGVDQIRYDARRDSILRSKGLKLIRFSNDEIFNCGELVVSAIKLFMTNSIGLRSDDCRARSWLQKRPTHGKDNLTR